MAGAAISGAALAGTAAARTALAEGISLLPQIVTSCGKVVSGPCRLGELQPLTSLPILYIFHSVP